MNTPYQQFTPYPYMQQPQPSFEWIAVNGLSEVKSYDLQQNKKAWFMDNNQPVFYVKYIDPTDSLGKPAIKGFRFEEISLEETEPKYITADELEEILKKFIKENNNNGKSSVKRVVAEE